MITDQELLAIARIRLSLDEKTGVFVWVNPHPKKPNLMGAVAGCLRYGGYWKIRIAGKEVNRSRLVFGFVHGRMPQKEVDHINGDTQDDRPKNLREVTHQQNSWNQRRRVDRDLPRGVRRLSGKYQARITVHGRVMCLGSYHSPDAAAVVYEKARKIYFGEFAA